MEITRKNFTKKLDYVLESIKDASFLAVDGEFTGLDTSDGRHVLPYDTAEERYYRVRQVSANFLLIQFGLCTFHYSKETRKYTARPFNFYVFPRPTTRSAPDARFLCQSSSIDFLASHGFDFNKVFREGISYLTPDQENTLREALQQKHQQYSQFSSPAFVTPDGAGQGVSKGPINIPEEHKEFIENICEKVNTFLSGCDGDKLELPSCTGFQRKLIYQTVRAKFTSGIHLETKSNEKKERCIVVTRIQSEEDMKKKEQAKQTAEVEDLDKAVGFSKVIRMISQSGKLVIGHNMMLDLVHILHQFCYPLPEKYEDFKMMTQCAFPKILDTKLMASTNPFKEFIQNTALSDLQKCLELKPFTKIQVDVPKDMDFKQYSTASGPLHEAGYDAYLTGVCFICMANYLGTFQKEQCDRVPPSSPLVQPFVNKIFLMRVSDMPYMNLAGPDLIPNRDHVFHVEFPKEWKTTDLFNLFSPFGGAQIHWLNDTSVFASLFIKEEAPKVIEKLSSKGGNLKVLTYHHHKTGHSCDKISRKRTATKTEDSQPAKKRKSLNVDAPVFVSRSITPPIPEENKSESTVNGDDKNSKSQPSPDQGEKLSYAAVTAKQINKGEKMFTEPDGW